MAVDRMYMTMGSNALVALVLLAGAAWLPGLQVLPGGVICVIAADFDAGVP